MAPLKSLLPTHEKRGDKRQLIPLLLKGVRGDFDSDRNFALTPNTHSEGYQDLNGAWFLPPQKADG